MASQRAHAPVLRLPDHAVAARAKTGGRSRAKPRARTAGIRGAGMQRLEMPRGGDAQRHRRDALPLDPPHQGAESFRPLGHAVDQVVDFGIDGGGRQRGNLGGRRGRGIAMFVKPDLFHCLAEIAGVQRPV